MLNQQQRIHGLDPQQSYKGSTVYFENYNSENDILTTFHKTAQKFFTFVIKTNADCNK